MEKEIYDILEKYLYGDNIKKMKNKTIEKIKYFISNKKTIEFVLPSFPGKSPNINSSFNGNFGYEEIYSIEILEKMLFEINKIYEYGAKIYIIHDGHLFTDLNITRNDQELDKYIEDFRKHIKNNIISISIKDLMHCNDNIEAREKFKKIYVSPLNKKDLSSELIKTEILFTRIEFEEQIKNNHIISSKNQMQIIAKKIAKESLLRKQGLTNCIKEKFKESIRFSIHYQYEDSEKLGFRLIDKAINFGSPWFNIIYKCDNGDIILGKKTWFINHRKLVSKHGYSYYEIDKEAQKQFINNNVSKIIKKEISIGR